MTSRIVIALSVLGLAACGNTGNGSDAGSDGGPAMCATPGMPTAGTADTHCAPDIVQETNQASCFGMSDAGMSDEDADVPDVDSGVPDSGVPDSGVPVEDCEYGATVFGMAADDDDCKYHFAWTSTPICEGTSGVRFTVVATNKSDGSPVTGAHLRAETFVTSADACDTTTRHPGPNTFVTFAEGTSGTYTGAIQFDQAGQWTVRFHVFEECQDAPEDSPHGHVAFRLTVP